MIMKKTCLLVALALLLTLSLVSCRQRAEDPTDGGATNGVMTEHAAKIAYYEALVGSLNDELLALRRELYVNGAEYEARIAALELELKAAMQQNGTSNPDFGTNAPGAEALPQSLFTYSILGNEATVTGYSGREAQVTVPATLGGVPVVAIGERAFVGNNSLQSVVLPEGVRSIGWFAFSGCVALSAVTIPTSVESIAYGAFENCHRTLTLACSRNSYAYQYAMSYGLRIQG